MATRDVGTGLWLWRASECCTIVRGTLHSCDRNNFSHGGGVNLSTTVYLLYLSNMILPGDSAQIQRECPHHKMPHVVSWNIPEH